MTDSFPYRSNTPSGYTAQTSLSVGTNGRFWLGDGYVDAGAVLDLADGRKARIREFAPVGSLPSGTWVCDPRNLTVCTVTGPGTEWPVVIGDGLCCMPGEILPVLDILSDQPAEQTTEGDTP